MAGIYTTEGIVLRSFNYRETSMICEIYTLDHGLRSYISGGIRSKKNAGKVNVFHPLNIVEIIAYPAGSDSLARLKEINYACHFKSLNQKVIPSAVGSFLIEVCRNSIKEKEPNEQLYFFLKDKIIDLDNGTYKLSLFHLKFLIELSTFLGFAPYNNFSSEYPFFDLSEGTFVSELDVDAKTLNQNLSFELCKLIATPFKSLNDLHIEKEMRDILLDKIILFYTYHIEDFKNILSLNILRTILS